MGTLSRVEPSSLTLKERLALKKKTGALLIDYSASMSIEIEPGKSRMQSLHEIIQGITTTPDIIIFGSNATQVKSKADIPTSADGGGTNMARAINLAKSLGHKSALMLTDGEASDPLETKEALKDGFELKVLYIGSGTRPAFLDEISKSASTEDLKMQKQLTDKIQLLIGPGNDEKERTISL